MQPSPFAVLLAAALVLPTAAVAQRVAETRPVPAQDAATSRDATALRAVTSHARFAPFGVGCDGGGSGGVCESLNAQAGGPLNVQFLVNEYAYGVRASRDTVVLGMRLYTQLNVSATSTEAFVPCAIYLQDSATTTVQAATSSAAVGTMRVATGGPAWWECYFDSPVFVAAGQRFWISQTESNAVNIADVLGGVGSTVPTFWRPPPGGSPTWTVSGVVQSPAWQVICKRDTQIRKPTLSYLRTPRLGRSFDALLRHALPGATGVLTVGGSNTSFLGLPLPLQFPTAPAACRVLASADIVVPVGAVGVDGDLNVPLLVPNNQALVGLQLYNQWFVDEGGVGGWRTSNGGSVTIGQ